VTYKSYWTRHIAWTDIKGFTDRTYSSPGAGWVWLLCICVRKGLGAGRWCSGDDES